MMKQARSKNRVLCLWIPQWPVQRVRLARPELKRRDFLLYEQYRRGCFRVVASTHKRGIVAGMPLAEATALADVHCEEHDPRADQAALVQLAGWCEQFSPLVGIEPPDNLCLNVTGLGPLFGSEELLVEQIARAFRRRELAVRVAVADTLGAAWAVAHYGPESPAIIPAGRATKAIASLPIAALRLPPEVVDILSELGIVEIGHLLSLPRDAVAARFDPQLLRRLDQATGLLFETIVSQRPPPEIVTAIELEYPAADQHAMEVVFRELLERVTRSLAERQQGAIQIECHLQCEDVKPIDFVVGLFRASAQAKHLLELTRMQLERISLPGPVAAVKLSVLIAAPLRPRQCELFEQSASEGRRQVGLLVDRLSNRLGREAVVRAIPQADAQPELAFRYEPLAGVPPRKAPLPRWRVLPRPLRLEQQPIPLEVLSMALHGPPIQFSLGGSSHRVARTWGPERIQTGWWRGRYVQRDYYRIETTTGKRFWLFRRLHDAKWFLHGVFD